MTMLYPLRRASLYLTGIAVCLCPILTSAQNAEVEIGTVYISEDSFKFGEYTGLKEEGAYAIGNLHIEKVSAYDDGTTEYWELLGKNLGLDSLSVFGEYGQQGKFQVSIEYGQSPKNDISDASTPYLGAGTSDQTLPSGFVGAANTRGMSNLVASLNPLEIKTERNKTEIGLSWIPMTNWEISGHYSHETKEGTGTLGSIFGTNGGNPRGSILAIPANYNFDEFELKIGQTGRKSQFQLSYHMSSFENDDAGVTWDNPYDDPGNWCVSCGRGDSPGEFSQGGRGRIGLDPDNKAHQINFNGGYNLARATRITANVSYGWMEQDDTFLPSSTVAAFRDVQNLPRENLAGEIKTLYANVTFSARPVKNLNIRARVTYDDRDNQTPRDIYLWVHNDSNLPSTADDSTDLRLNRPYSMEKSKFKLDAGYRLGMGNKLSFGFEYEEVDRDFSEVANMDEQTFSVKLSNTSLDYADGWIKYNRSSREGSDYVTNQQFLDGHDPAVVAHIAATDFPGLYENDPLLIKFMMADRERDLVSAAVNLYPSDLVSFSITGTYRNDDYEKKQVGLHQSKNSNITFDVAYNPENDFDAYAFVTFEDFESSQMGYRRRGGPFPPGVARSPGSFWTIDSTDDVLTFGAGIKWVVVEDKFNVEIDYLSSDAQTEIEPNSSGLTFLPFPDDITTELSSISLSGEYAFRENMRLRFRYLYEKYETKDFALDNVTSNTLANIILPGNSSPNYGVKLIALSCVFSF